MRAFGDLPCVGKIQMLPDGCSVQNGWKPLLGMGLHLLNKPVVKQVKGLRLLPSYSSIVRVEFGGIAVDLLSFT
jgi:hypothetical protein